MVDCVAGNTGHYELHVALSRAHPNLPKSGISYYSTLEDARQAMEAAKSSLVNFGATRVNRSVVLTPGTKARAEYLLGHEPSPSKGRVLDRLKAFFASVPDAIRAACQRLLGKEPVMASSEPVVSEMRRSGLLPEIPVYELSGGRLGSMENDLYSSVYEAIHPSLERSTSTSDLTSSVEEDLDESFQWESDGLGATSLYGAVFENDSNFDTASTLGSGLDTELAEIQQTLSKLTQQMSGKLDTVSLSSTESIFIQGLTVEPQGVDDYLSQLDERLKFKPQVAQGLEADTTESSLAAALLEKMRELDASAARLTQVQEAIIKAREPEGILSMQFAELINGARKLV